MKILILSVTTGGGHNMVSSAVSDALTQRGHELICADLFQLCGIPAKLPDLLYRFSASHLRRSYHRVYNRLLESPALRRKLKTCFMPSRMLTPLKRYLEQTKPDCVIASHVFAAMLVGELKAADYFSFPLVSILTDYCIHPFWESCLCMDALILPSGYLCSAAKERGISADILYPIGLPLRRSFDSRSVPAERKRELGLSSAPLVLLMGGSMGYGRIFSVALALRKRRELNIVCICGKNRLLYAALHPFRRENLTVLGYIDALPQYMCAADLAVTKPGGITLAELSSAALPALLFDAIPGHEEYNLQFWEKYGGCRDFSSASCTEIASAAGSLLSDSEELSRMENAQRRMSFPQAAENLCKFVESLDKIGKHGTIHMK